MSANTPTVPPVETVQPPPPEWRLSGLAMVIDGELRVPAGVVDLELEPAPELRFEILR